MYTINSFFGPKWAQKGPKRSENYKSNLGVFGMVYWVAEFISGVDLILQLIFLVNFWTTSVDFPVNQLIDFQLILQSIN